MNEKTRGSGLKAGGCGTNLLLKRGLNF